MNMFEIRWHGRGGQGAKTASILLGKIASATGKYIQAFPEYGPERMGAPILAYTRIADRPIHQHCQIESPDVVVVLDPTLIGTVDITANLNKSGKLIINSDREPEDLKTELKLVEGIELYTLNANKISEQEIGKIIPNTPMMGAFNEVTGLMEEEDFLNQAQKEFEKKFATKPEVVEGNVRSVSRAYQEVKGP